MRRISSAEVVIAVLIIAMLFVGIFGGMFVSEQVAIKALDDQGYSNIKITHHAWFLISLRGGDKRDAARFTAVATNPAGKTVTIYVFTGWLFKGATIRSL